MDGRTLQQLGDGVLIAVQEAVQAEFGVEVVGERDVDHGFEKILALRFGDIGQPLSLIARVGGAVRAFDGQRRQPRFQPLTLGDQCRALIRVAVERDALLGRRLERAPPGRRFGQHRRAGR
jgi:hypothetical protein